MDFMRNEEKYRECYIQNRANAEKMQEKHFKTEYSFRCVQRALQSSQFRKIRFHGTAI